jgi:archaeosine synthase
VVRTVEASEGLGLAGSASLGPLGLRTPTLLWAEGRRPAGLDPATAIDLRWAGAAPPGHRRLLLEQGERRWQVDLPVPAPEISGGSGRPVEVAPGWQLIHWPLEVADWEALRKASPEGIVLGNARVLLAEGEPFVRAIRDIRGRVGAGPLLWAPRTALPHRLATLAYLSVDIVDTTAGLWSEAEGTRFDTELGELDPTPGPARSEGEVPDLLSAYRAELERIRWALAGRRLRELVELRQAAEPLLAEILRYADATLGEMLEERSPLLGGPTRTYVLRDSFRRPEVRRFRARLLERYRPPPEKRVLLLVPCSRTKPYRNSRSHRRFAEAWREVPGAERLHVVSVTSPLGVVPRELEDMPPARHYDIPVTGEWDEAERAAVLAGVAHLRTHGRYASTIVHLDPGEYSFLRPILPAEGSIAWTLTDDRPTSPEALRALRAEVERALSTEGPVVGGPLAMVRQELEEIAAFQFGRDAASRLFAPPVRLHGRPWFQRLTDGGGTDLAVWQEERGLYHLTVAGAARLGPGAVLSVEVDPAVRLTGDLFTPGVRRADPAIRIGDAVLLTLGGELAAVGEAALPGRLMTELPRGLAVRVRHRVRRADGASNPPTST